MCVKHYNYGYAKIMGAPFNENLSIKGLFVLYCVIVFRSLYTQSSDRAICGVAVGNGKKPTHIFDKQTRERKQGNT